MGMGPRTNLYNIGGDPLTQYKNLNYIFLKFVLQKKRWQWENERKIFCRWPTDPFMQSIEHSSLSTALVTTVGLPLGATMPLDSVTICISN